MDEKAARSYLKSGTEFPYDDGPITDDWAMRAARGVLWNLSDLRGIGHALREVDDDIRIEIVKTLAAIITVAAPQLPESTPVVDHGEPPKLQWDTRGWPHTARGKGKDKYFIDLDSNGLFYAYRINGEDINSVTMIAPIESTCYGATVVCQNDYEKNLS